MTCIHLILNLVHHHITIYHRKIIFVVSTGLRCKVVGTDCLACQVLVLVFTHSINYCTFHTAIASGIFSHIRTLEWLLCTPPLIAIACCSFWLTFNTSLVLCKTPLIAIAYCSFWLWHSTHWYCVLPPNKKLFMTPSVSHNVFAHYAYFFIFLALSASSNKVM